METCGCVPQRAFEIFAPLTDYVSLMESSRYAALDQPYVPIMPAEEINTIETLCKELGVQCAVFRINDENE